MEAVVRQRPPPNLTIRRYHASKEIVRPSIDSRIGSFAGFLRERLEGGDKRNVRRRQGSHRLHKSAFGKSVLCERLEFKIDVGKMVKGLHQFKSSNQSEQALQQLSTCIVDKIYDKATPETLNGLASGNISATVSSSDKALVKSATRECINQLKQQMGGGAGNQ